MNIGKFTFGKGSWWVKICAHLCLLAFALFLFGTGQNALLGVACTWGRYKYKHSKCKHIQYKHKHKHKTHALNAHMIYTCMYVWIVYSPCLLDVIDLIGLLCLIWMHMHKHTTHSARTCHMHMHTHTHTCSIRDWLLDCLIDWCICWLLDCLDVFDWLIPSVDCLIDHMQHQSEINAHEKKGAALQLLQTDLEICMHT